MIKNIVILFFWTLMSCNTRLFVDKSEIIHDTKGYLLYYHPDKCLFIPSRDTLISQFFNNTDLKKGYALYDDACGIYGLKFVSRKFDVNMVYLDNNREVYLKDSIYIVMVNFRYLKNSSKSVTWKDTIEFIHNDIKYKINASDKYFGEVMKVVGNGM